MVKDEPECVNKLFIGGLDHRTTNESLKAHFEQYGEIVDVIVMKDPQTKRSRGFGFVAYSEAYMVDEAMKNLPHTIDGRTVDTKRAVPRDQLGGRGSDRIKKIFVGGIKDITEQELRDTFSTYGDIVSVSVPVDRETHKNRGFAFVEFADSGSADKAAAQKQMLIQGINVDVKKARDKNDMNRPRGGGAGGYGGWGGGGRDSYGAGDQGGYGYNGSQGYDNSGYGQQGGSQGWGSQSGGSQGWSGYADNSSGSWGGYGGDSSANSWGNQQGDFGSHYGQSYSGGPVRGHNSYYQNSRSTPYNS